MFDLLIADESGVYVSAYTLGFFVAERPQLTTAKHKFHEYSIDRRDGSDFVNLAIEDKELTIVFNGNFNDGLKDPLNYFKHVLMTAKKIKVSDESTYFKVKQVEIGSIDNEIATYANFEVRFIVAGYEESENRYVSTLPEGVTTINYDGTYKTPPRYEIDFTSDNGFVGITTSDGSMVLGDLDETDRVYAPNSEYLLKDEMTELSNWNIGSTVATPNIIKSLHIPTDGRSGSVYVDSEGTNLSPTNLGAGAGWHGASLLTKPFKNDVSGINVANNFDFFANFQMSSKEVKRVSNLHIALIADDGQPLMSFAIWDSSKLHKTYKINFNIFTQGGGRRTIKYDKYDGDLTKAQIRFIKKGERFEWKFLNWKETKGKDTKNVQTISIGDAHRSVSQVYIYMAGHGTNPIHNNFKVTACHLSKLHTTRDLDVRNVFRAGDKLIVDNETGEITLNGYPFYSRMANGSQFTNLTFGENPIGLTFSPWATTKPETKIYYRKRWI